MIKEQAAGETSGKIKDKTKDKIKEKIKDKKAAASASDAQAPPIADNSEIADDAVAMASGGDNAVADAIPNNDDEGEVPTDKGDMME